MSAKNGRRRQPLRPQQVPLPPWNKPLHVQRQEAAIFGYMKRVLVDAADGEEPECDANIAAGLAGMILGQHVASRLAGGMAFDQALAAALQWVADQAALTGSAAASGETPAGVPADTGGVPTHSAATAGAAAYAVAVMDGRVPKPCPSWMAPVLAVMVHSALVAGFMHADGLDQEAAVSATQAKLAAMARGED